MWMMATKRNDWAGDAQEDANTLPDLPVLEGKNNNVIPFTPLSLPTLPRPARWPRVVAKVFSLIFSAVLAAGLTLAGYLALPYLTPRAQPPPEVAQPAPPPVTYAVQPGDSLASIAQAKMGAWQRWEELFAANRDTVARPSALDVGMVLVIPEIR